MESGAKGCEVIVSGKLRAARAKSMKFKDGYMVSSGNPVEEYIDYAVRHVMLRQGVLGLKVTCPAPLDPALVLPQDGTELPGLSSPSNIFQFSLSFLASVMVIVLMVIMLVMLRMGK